MASAEARNTAMGLTSHRSRTNAIGMKTSSQLRFIVPPWDGAPASTSRMSARAGGRISAMRWVGPSKELANRHLAESDGNGSRGPLRFANFSRGLANRGGRGTRRPPRRAPTDQVVSAQGGDGTFLAHAHSPEDRAM